MIEQIQIRSLGKAEYQPTWNAMRAFTDARTESTLDEIWLVEHPSVYTMGLKGRDGTLSQIDHVPLVYSDRGGDITYHGPGQVVLYPLIDIARLGIGIKTLVQALEQTVIDHLAQCGIDAQRKPSAPGVYVEGKKIAALGLRIRHGRSYHGLSFNVDMDLAPFTRIDPCGYQGLEVTQLVDLNSAAIQGDIGLALAHRLARLLGYNAPVISQTAVTLPHG